MRVPFTARVLLSSVLFLGAAAPSVAEPAGRTIEAQQRVRVTGVVRDESNAITLPGLPVEVVGADQTVYTDVDGRYVARARSRAPIRSKWRWTAIRSAS